MPNRVIREGLLDSEQVNSLSDSAFRFFTHLLLAADDAGRLDGRTDLLRARCFPVGSRRSSDVQKLLEETVAQRLVKTYTVKGKPFVQVMKWRKGTNSATSRCPSEAGTFKIEFREVDTRDGLVEFVSTSLWAADDDPTPTPSAPHADGVGTPSGPSRTETETETGSGAARPRPAGKVKRVATDDHSELVRHFCDGWAAGHGGTKYAFDGAKDGVAVKWLLANAGGVEDAKRIVTAYLGDPDPWIAGKGHSLAVLRSQFNSIRGRMSSPPPSDPDAFVRVDMDDDEADRILGFAPGTSRRSEVAGA